jgi:hypothetical protein
LCSFGLGLLFAPEGTLRLLQSKAEYGDGFPRVAGMLMSGLGFSVFGIFLAGVPKLYPATIIIRMYFLACLAAFYWMTTDPLFLVLILIVGIGFVLTLSAHLLDRREKTERKHSLFPPRSPS